MPMEPVVLRELFDAVRGLPPARTPKESTQLLQDLLAAFKKASIEVPAKSKPKTKAKSKAKPKRPASDPPGRTVILVAEDSNLEARL